jgi:threonylcarbamoyladenosine tRNA methylthiotransferase MtaB
MKRSIAFKTLGCRLNQSETDCLVSEFHHAGYRIVEFSKTADVYIINTCTVTNPSDKKSRNLISQASRKNINAMVVVTGCMVNNYRDTLKDVLKDIPGSVYFVENNLKSSIFRMVDAHLRGEIIQNENFQPGVFDFKPAETSLHTRSMIKIQDGCDHYCTFCIVPYVRGRAVSRPPIDIINNIREIIDSGFREIVITGVNIGRYKYEDTSFDDLIEKILVIPGDFRVRISSIEPYGLGDKFFRLFSNPKLMPHLHLCMQSGSDRILLKMRRAYSYSDFRSIIDKIRNNYNDFNFTTDILVGFPGETDQDFQATCKAAREIGFSHIHTFKYSRRKGTRADQIPDQVPEKIKNERSEIVRKISVENKLTYRKSLIGKTQNVLVEKIKGKTRRGYGELYVPIEFKHPLISRNMIQKVLLTGLGEGEDPVVFGNPQGSGA